jgi:hypothetical protein
MLARGVRAGKQGRDAWWRWWGGYEAEDAGREVGGRFVDRNIERGESLLGSRCWAGPNRGSADAFVGREC